MQKGDRQVCAASTHVYTKNSHWVNKHSEGQPPLGKGQAWNGKVLLFRVNCFKMVLTVVYKITF